MKTIMLTLTDEAAEAFEKLSETDKSKTAFFIEAYTKPLNEQAFANTLLNMAREARANGLTEKEIEIFLDTLS